MAAFRRPGCCSRSGQSADPSPYHRKVMKLLHNTAAALCWWSDPDRHARLRHRICPPAANSRLVGENLTTWCRPKRPASP